MNRYPLRIAVSVFAFSVIAELLSIKILRGSLTAWLDHRHRLLLLLSMVLVNLLNAATALYFSARAVGAEIKLQLSERKQREVGTYLNRHLRDALSVIQDAALLTKDEKTIKMCDEAVRRIVMVLVSSESGLPDPSEVLFASELASGRSRQKSA